MLDGFFDVSQIARPGVYALLLRGEVVYVGKSKCMMTRIDAHRSLFRRKAPKWLPITGVQFDQVFVRPCAVAMLDLLEREMIDKYKPRLNKNLKTSDPISAPISVVVAGIALALNKKPEEQLRRRF